MPLYAERFHRPSFREALAGALLRADDRMWPQVSSAAEMMFEVGALTTMTPASVAACVSTLSIPTQARAMTFSFFAAPIASASIVVAERISTASASASAGSSWSRSEPSVLRISKSVPRAPMVAGESSSAMSTPGLDTNDTLSIIGKPCRERTAHRIHLSARHERILHWYLQ